MAQARGGSAGFDAFITYSHDVDHGLAAALASRLERVATPWYRRRRLRIFLDRLTLGAQTLDGTIRSALTRSRYLIVLASPETAASRWVQTETGYWLAEHPDGAQRTLIVLTAGDLRWNAAMGAYEADCLPPAFLHPGVFAAERKWVDVRGLDAVGPAAHDDDLGDAVAELAAEILGTTKDDIRGQEVRARRRARRALGASISTLAIFVAALVALTFALRSSGQEVTLRERVARSRSLAAAALSEGSPDLALLLAAQAAKEAPTEEAHDALLQVLNRNGRLTSMRRLPGMPTHSDDPGRALLLGKDSVEIVDLKTGATSSVRAPGIADATDATISSRGDVAISTGTTTTLWRPPYAQPSSTVPTGGAVRYTHDGRHLVLRAPDGLHLINADDGRPTRPPLPLDRGTRGCTDTLSAAASDDLRIVVVAGCQTVTAWDGFRSRRLAIRKITAASPDTDGITATALSPDGSMFAVGTSLVPAALDGSVMLFTTRTLEPLMPQDAALQLDQHDGAVADLAFDRGGGTLGIAATTPQGQGSRTTRFEVVHLGTGRLEVLGPPWAGGSAAVIEAGQSAGTFLSGDDQGRLAQWDSTRSDGVSEPLWHGTGGLVAAVGTADAKVLAIGLVMEKALDPRTGDADVQRETLLVDRAVGRTQVIERSAATALGGLPSGGSDIDSSPLVLSPDSQLVLTGEGLRDAHSGRMDYPAQTRSGAFSMDGTRALIGRVNGTVILLTTKAATVQRVFQIPANPSPDSSPDASSSVVATSFLDHNTKIGAVSSDGHIVVFDSASGRVLSSWVSQSPQGGSGEESRVVDATFDASGHDVALFRSMTGDVGIYGSVDVWDLSSGRRRARLDDAFSRGDFIDQDHLLMVTDTRHALVSWAIGGEAQVRPWMPLAEFDQVGEVRVLNAQSALTAVTREDGSAQVLRVPLAIQPLAVHACAVAGRRFTTDERAQFLTAQGMTPACS
jgi:WD40 repeat protein